MIKYLPVMILCCLMWGCIGSFNTNETLSENYVMTASDENIAIFYTAYPTIMEVAVKNVGSAFMTNLNVAFDCKMKHGSKSSLYSLGNLKPYFNKVLKVPIIYNDCLLLKVDYSYFPENDGGFISTGQNISNLPQLPTSQFWGTIEIK